MGNSRASSLLSCAASRPFRWLRRWLPSHPPAQLPACQLGLRAASCDGCACARLPLRAVNVWSVEIGHRPATPGSAGARSGAPSDLIISRTRVVILVRIVQHPRVRRVFTIRPTTTFNNDFRNLETVQRLSRDIRSLPTSRHNMIRLRPGAHLELSCAQCTGIPTGDRAQRSYKKGRQRESGLPRLVSVASRMRLRSEVGPIGHDGE